MFNWLRDMFPYTNFHELNADWLLKTTKDASEKADQAYNIAQHLPDIVDELDNRLNATEGRVGRLADDVLNIEPLLVDFTALTINTGWIQTGSEITCNKTSTEIQAAINEGKPIIARLWLGLDAEEPVAIATTVNAKDRRTVYDSSTPPQPSLIRADMVFHFPVHDGILSIYKVVLSIPERWASQYYTLSVDTRRPDGA